MSIRVRQIAATALTCLLVGATVGGCGGSSSSSGHVHFAKTKFALHAGLAFGAFHRYIYRPYKEGRLLPPSRHKAAVVKAGVAAAFAYHETKIALNDARSSAILRRLLAPLLALQDRLRGISGPLKSGQVPTGEIQSTNGAVNSVGSTSASAGVPIKDRSPTL